MAALSDPKAEQFSVEREDELGRKKVVRGREVYEEECRTGFGQMPMYWVP